MKTGHSDDISYNINDLKFVNGLLDNLEGVTIAFYPVWLTLFGRYFIKG